MTGNPEDNQRRIFQVGTQRWLVNLIEDDLLCLIQFLGEEYDLYSAGFVEEKGSSGSNVSEEERDTESDQVRSTFPVDRNHQQLSDCFMPAKS